MEKVSKRWPWKRRSTVSKKKRSSLAKVVSSVPRITFSSLPAEFNVQFSFSYRESYVVDGGPPDLATKHFVRISTFNNGLEHTVPQYLTPLLSMYSSARIRKTHSIVELLAPFDATGSCRTAGAVLPHNEVEDLPLTEEIMDKLKSMTGGQSGFIGSFQGGHDVFRFNFLVDHDKWSTSINSPTAVTRSEIVGAQLLISHPVQDDLDYQPAIGILISVLGSEAVQVEVLTKITYHVTFQGLHLGFS